MKNDTLKKLKAMRLPAFAAAYQKQIEQEAQYCSMSFHERLMLLVDAEYDSQHNNKIKKLIKNAKFSDSSAFLGNIEYLPDRHLNRDLLESLADNGYIRQGLNVILIGATGSGKSFIANALGVNACQYGYKTRYIRLPELFSELEAAGGKSFALRLIESSIDKVDAIDDTPVMDLSGKDITPKDTTIELQDVGLSLIHI